MKKSPQVEQLEQTIDSVTTENWDLKDRVRKLESENTCLREQVKGAHEVQQRLQTSGNEELRRAWDKVNIAEKEQERIENNYQHAQQTIHQLNVTLQDAKKEMEKLRKAQVSEEHLARKLVQLCDENTKLRGDISDLKAQEKAACEIMTQKLESHPDFKKYQEQVTRLLAERVTLDCQLSYAGGEQGTFCGGCLSCQLKQAQAIIAQTAENLKKKNQDMESCGKTISDISKSHEENRKLLQSIQKQTEKWKTVARQYEYGLQKIAAGAFWRGPRLAQNTLNGVDEYKKDNNVL